ncbi:hypothetical protein SAMD00019534_039110 [Acytostelium subglobosum LB1]|uniref:hypothetical protein n=1 Tax=Acytostelium subglobosum LB1 TaxID=1410327 RepID=UPI000644C0E5|nr:hypothetical protein SAMD00019534_039110 [Acytostelium subglobosum LB1]GAM20736.1 hypothetical protein SAMD00019534_039110 [Acytostelium subglobosum LB1]|eukprot:XP_012755870.1 hypothetical protein SAMD00019534_039110 [Acytostelium subglobosum LB1]
MNLLTTNGVKIYNVSAGKSLPEWLSEKKRDQLRKDEEFRQRIELIQDFAFETSSRRVKITPDGQYLMATGIYPPQLKVFELNQLSSKVTRTLDSQIVQFEVLSDDYSKPVFLREDRYIEFHAKYGTYFKTRIPKLGRDITYHRPSCDLYIGAGGNEVYRLNLEEGRFMTPLVTDLPAVNVVAQNPVHQLMMFGGENGAIECWDPRQRTKVSALNVASSIPGYNIQQDDVEISAGKFGPDGLLLGLGTSNGVVMLYDMRAANPVMTKHHQYQLPINSINFHTYAGVTRFMSSDSKILKAFDKDTGKLFMVLEPKSPINDVLSIDGTGLIIMPGETEKIQSYYVPSLGPAPKWSSFLDNLTEELEEDKQLVYENYKFITRDEVEKLDIEKMIGTNLLRAYMHGFFIHIKLYNKIKAAQNPFEYQEYRANRIEQEMKKQTGSRIAAKTAVKRETPKVNAKMANRMQAIKFTHSEDDKEKKQKEKEAGANALHDPRFAKLFIDPNFEAKEDSEEFKRLNPRGKLARLDSAIAEHFEEVDSDDEDDDQDVPVSNGKGRGTNGKAAAAIQDDEDDDFDDGEDDAYPTSNGIGGDDNDVDYDDGEDDDVDSKRPKKKVSMYEIRAGHSVSSLNKKGQNTKLLQNAPFSVRVDKEEKGINPLKNATVVTKDSGDLEISFIPSKVRRPSHVEHGPKSSLTNIHSLTLELFQSITHPINQSINGPTADWWKEERKEIKG